MSSDFLVVDLTAYTPGWLDAAGKKGDIWPSYCLPWFAGEDPLVGDLSRDHRRASQLESFISEAVLALDNRGRRHWAEGWIELMRDPDTPQLTEVVHEWLPPGEKRVAAAKFSRAILCLCLQIQAQRGRDPSGTRLGLVVPGGLGTGPQEDLINVLDDVFVEGVQLFPRPVAAALAWAGGDEAEQLMARRNWSGGEYPGYLLTTIVSADYWESDCVRMRVDDRGGVPLLCPVQDRTQHVSEFDVVGLAARSHEGGGDPQGSRWTNWLLRDDPVYDVAIQAQAYQAACADLGVVAQSANDPNIAPLAVGVMELASRQRQLGRLLGHLHVGARHQGMVPDPFRCPSDIPQPLFDDGICLLQGAAEGMRRLDANRAPYYESLAPLTLKVDSVNEFLDPVQDWKPLLDNAEVPAGEEYRTKQPIEGLALPGGEQASVDLFIRTERRRSKTFRRMTAARTDQSPDDEPVTVAARMRPGRGQARVTVESVRRGAFYAELREQELEQVDEPVMTYAWPPGSAVILSHPKMAAPASDLMARVTEAHRKDYMDYECFEDAHNWLSKWRPLHDALEEEEEIGRLPRVVGTLPAQDVEIPGNVQREFVYGGALSSGREFDLHPAIKNVLPDFIAAIEDIVQTDWDADQEWVRAKSRTIAGWLYDRCPSAILEGAKAGLREDNAARYLEIAGRCFSSDAHVADFFGVLAWRIRRQDAIKLNWWRAYRNLAQLRPFALSENVLSAADQDVIVGHYVEQFGAYKRKYRSPFFKEFCRLACHILKRRRFDEAFLDIGSTVQRQLRDVLAMARAEAEGAGGNGVYAKICDVAMDFVDKKATPGSLRELASADGSDA